MKANICVASQDLDAIKPLITTLQDIGHQVVTCEVPNTVITRCKEAQFDVVFIDALIHSYNEIIISLNNACPGTEVVVITTYAFPESMITSDALSIIGYLIKPLTEAKIKNITARALRQGELSRENRRLLLAVTSAKKEWEATVDAIEDPIFITDFNYTIIRANLALFRKLGKGVKGVIGRKCYDILHASPHPLDQCPGKRARDTGDPVSDTRMFAGLRQRCLCSVYPQVFASRGGLVHYLREPSVDIKQQAKTLTKYERLFDDAGIPIVFVSADELQVTDANQKAISLFGYEPEEILNIDLESLFTKPLRESIINNIMEQTRHGEPPLRVKLLDLNMNEIDAFVIANAIEIDKENYIELFIIPVDVLSRIRQG
jgi:PAS domain S-box-containing protein